MDSSAGGTRGGQVFAVLLVLSVLLAVAQAIMVKAPGPGDSVRELTYFTGPTADSLLHGRGLSVCTEAMGTPGDPICFHSGRMPMAAAVVALGVKLCGDHFRRITVMKTLLLLTPLEFAMYLACFQLPVGKNRRLVALLLLAAPFLMMQFLALVVNLQVEECYSYAFLALAVAMLLFRGYWERQQASGVAEGVVMGLALAAFYLSKSSMILAALVLLAAFLLRTRSRAARSLVVVLMLAATLGWGAYQRHAGGRFTLGTSMDGINLHKGNDAIFQREYSRWGDVDLDRFDGELNHGMHFADEWSFNDYHRSAALEYIKSHPRETLSGWMKKLNVFFVSTTQLGIAAEQRTDPVAYGFATIPFRLVFWAAIGLACLGLFRFRGLPQWESAVFLAVVAAVALPYVLGFCYTRHASILIYPSVLFCCRCLDAKRAVIAEGAA